MTWKRFRIGILLLVLVCVALDSLLERGRLTSWERPLRVVIYPINGDDSAAAARVINQLTPATFESIERYFTTEGARHQLKHTDLLWIQLAPPLARRPPPIPYGGNALTIAWWSLKQRFWMWRHDNFAGITPELRVLALYYDPRNSPAVPHSTGLSKGRIAITHIFAGQHSSNNIVLAHELLHTLGASDKYDLATGQPVYPAGYAEPERNPVHPQSQAELMGGRIALSATQSEFPRTLGHTRIGPITAAEIGWLAE